MNSHPPNDGADQASEPAEPGSPTPVDAHGERERLRQMSETRAGVYDTHVASLRSLREDLDQNESERRQVAALLQQSLVQQQVPMSAMLDLTGLIRRGAGTEELLQAVLMQALRLFEADKSSIMIPDEAGTHLYIAASHSLGKPVREDFRLPIGEGVAGRVFATGQREIIHDTSQADEFTPHPEGSEPKYLVAVPLEVDGEVLGVMSLERPVGMWASPDRVDQLHAFAAHAAMQLRNIQVYEQLLNRIEELSVLCEISRELSSSLEHEQLLQNIVESSCKLLHCGIASLMLFNDDKQAMRIRHAVGLPDEVVQNAVVPTGRGVSGWVAERGEPLLIKDITQDDRFRPRGEQRERASKYTTRSLLSVPLRIGTEVVGVLNVNNKANNAVFTEQDCETLTLLASQAAVSIENARLYETLQRLAVTDPLTKLFRRNYFEDEFEKELNRCRRYGRPLSVMMLDIDHFKSVNDTYGHQIGDVVLQGLAGLLRRYGRKDDVIARYGGEEFIAMLVETDSGGAQVAGERVRAAAEEFAFQVGRPEPLRITVSVGHASFPDHADDMPSLIAKADLALYAAKHGGRNQVLAYRAGLDMKGGA